MLKLTGESRVADELELTLWNSIIGLHSYSGRWATYNTPMDGVRRASAHEIVFQSREGTPELNCCSVNSARGFGMISDWALMRDADGLLVNWYGLDVVKTKIEALGGFVEVETELGKGSRFYIRLPLTLAIIQALLVMVGEEKYAIQLSSIHKITNIPASDVKLVQKQEVVMYRNTVIPIVRLDRVLEVPRESYEAPKNLTLVIVKKGERLTGLVVDKILGQQEIVQKSLGKFLSGIKIITSATILGDGNVALILDVNALAN
jgi:chemotaxis signal transduction protein